MKPFFVCAFLVLLIPAIGQHIRIEPRVGFLNCTQDGKVYVPEDGHSPPLYYQAIDIERDFLATGFGVTTWYSLNFGTSAFEKIAIGVESGLLLNKGRQEISKTPIEKARNWNIRIPLMVGIRTGTAANPHKGKFGAGVSTGLEFFRSAIPDESGTFLLPKICFTLGLKNIFASLSLYPSKMVTVYYLEGEVIDSLTTSVFDLSVHTAINWYPKQYRPTKKVSTRIM